jgi:hypothetical protein
VIGVNLRRSIQGGVVALALVLSGCSWFDSDGSSSGSTPSAEPSPTPTEFEQSFAGDVSGEAAEITATAERTGAGITADNVGFSFEATDLADPRLDPAESNLDEQLKSLGSPALRFGGNALDRRTFWTSKGEKPTHDEEVTVTPDDLKRLKKLVDATGSSVTIGIPLGAYDPKRGADMAAHAVDILGDSLVGLAIGNEPNGYTVDDVPSGAVRGKGWNKDKYVKQLEAYAKAIHAKRPDAPIIGPDVYDGAWMTAFADSDVKKKAALSQHWYQLYECDSTKVPGRGPQAANLIDPLAKTAAKKNLGIGKDKADDAGLPLWLEETGPTSCPGTNDTSLTNASALWAADYTLYAAALGVERMAMHSMLGACNGGSAHVAHLRSGRSRGSVEDVPSAPEYARAAAACTECGWGVHFDRRYGRREYERLHRGQERRSHAGDDGDQCERRGFGGWESRDAVDAVGVQCFVGVAGVRGVERCEECYAGCAGEPATG